jgi:hypothetical protein
VSIVRMFGVGLALAVVMDATLVRMCVGFGCQFVDQVLVESEPATTRIEGLSGGVLSTSRATAMM